MVKSWPRAANTVSSPGTGTHLQAQRQGTAVAGGPAPHTARFWPSLSLAATQPGRFVGSRKPYAHNPGHLTDASQRLQARSLKSRGLLRTRGHTAPPEREGHGHVPQHLRDALGQTLEVLNEDLKPKPNQNFCACSHCKQMRSFC